MKKILSVTLLVLFGTNLRAQDATPISRCGTVIKQPGTYVVDRNLTCTNSTGAAITISARAVNLSLGGRRITGAGGYSGYGILIKDVGQVYINGTGAILEKFFTNISVENSHGVTIGASINNSFKMSPTQNAFTVNKSTEVSISSVMINVAPNLGLSAFNCKNLKIGNFLLGTGNMVGSQGIIIGTSENVELSSTYVKNTGKGLQLMYSKGVTVKNTNITDSTWALSVDGLQDTVIRESKFAGNAWGLTFAGNPNSNLTIENVTATSGNSPKNALCIWGNYSLTANLVNTTPAVATKCIQ